MTKPNVNPNPPNLSARRKWLTALLFLTPGLLLLGKWSALPTSDFFWRWCSFTHLPAVAMHRLEYVLFVPMSAALVVFFRLTLGVRLLGPFRSILIGVAFQITGILAGLLFLVLTIAIIVALRPSLKSLRLPYFARISIMLGVVSLIMIAAILGGEGLGLKMLGRVAYFPIVVICLTAEGFACTLTREGWPSACWRGGTTALVAVLITLISQIPSIAACLMKFPELLLLPVGLIVLIAEFCDWRLLEKFNPPVKKRQRSHSAQAATQNAASPGDAGLEESLDEAEEQTQTQ